MVVPKDESFVSEVYEVVFVVEDTANLVPYFDVLMKSYIKPTLEFFNNGPPDPIDYGIDYHCTLYNVVTFHAGDVAPAPAASCTLPTNSIHEIITHLEKLELVGGAGQASSHVAEGLSTALQVFDDFKRIRYPGVSSTRHCVLVCNSPPYHMAAEESSDYSGYNSEQLASMMGKRGIHLSILSPKKMCALQKMFDAAGAGEMGYSGHPQKDYTTDPRHMVLLHGYQLQERSHSPASEDDKQMDPNKLAHSDECASQQKDHLFEDECASQQKDHLFEDECASQQKDHLFEDECASQQKDHLFEDECASQQKDHLFEDEGGEGGPFKVPSSTVPSLQSMPGMGGQPGSQPNAPPHGMMGAGGQMMGGPPLPPHQMVPGMAPHQHMQSHAQTSLVNMMPGQMPQGVPRMTGAQIAAVRASMQTDHKNQIISMQQLPRMNMMGAGGNVAMSTQSVMMVPPGQSMASQGTMQPGHMPIMPTMQQGQPGGMGNPMGVSSAAPMTSQALGMSNMNTPSPNMMPTSMAMSQTPTSFPGTSQGEAPWGRGEGGRQRGSGGGDRGGDRGSSVNTPNPTMMPTVVAVSHTPGTFPGTSQGAMAMGQTPGTFPGTSQGVMTGQTPDTSQGAMMGHTPDTSQGAMMGQTPGTFPGTSGCYDGSHTWHLTGCYDGSHTWHLTGCYDGSHTWHLTGCYDGSHTWHLTGCYDGSHTWHLTGCYDGSDNWHLTGCYDGSDTWHLPWHLRVL
ncbi:hypothetical protein ACOMHN_041551 [Nucella lapillus]